MRRTAENGLNASGSGLSAIDRVSRELLTCRTQLELASSSRSVPVVFVIPAFNEAENLPRLFADLEERPDALRRPAAA